MVCNDWHKMEKWKYQYCANKNVNHIGLHNLVSAKQSHNINTKLKNIIFIYFQDET